ncbi:MAG: ABC transporter ATP-binding protein [Pseudomonadota bacterium]|nr:ABC transporter ATP-binding protein [Pseudomonadota bacterium]
MARPPAKTLEVRGLAKAYRLPDGRSAPAVRDFSLRVEPGELVTLLGPSGCGKTTVLRTLAGLEEPDQGDMLLDGRSIRALPSHRRRIGLVFQNYALFPHLTVFENVAYSFRIRRTPEAEVRSAVTAALASVDLEPMASRLPGQLSGGQQQRVALARAFVMQPDLLLFDEPLSNLDAKLRVQVRGELRRLQKRLGTTALYVTHDQDEAMSLSDRIAVMRDGRVEQIGTAEEIYARPASLFVADFVGRVNALPGRVVARTGQHLTVETLHHRIDVPAQACTATDVLVLVRPEAVQLVPMASAEPRGVVEQMEYCGDRIEYAVRVGGMLVVAIESVLGREGRIAVGEHVSVSLTARAVHLLPADEAGTPPHSEVTPVTE